MKYARIWDTDWVDDDRTKSDCNIQKKRTLYLELRMRGEMKLTYKNLPAERWDVRHQWQRENQDQHKAHETRQWRDTLGEHVNVRVVLVFLVLVLFLLSQSFLAHIAWLKMFACLCHLIHASSSFSHSSSTSSSSCYSSTSPRMICNTVYSVTRRWSLMTNPSPTQKEEEPTPGPRRNGQTERKTKEEEWNIAKMKKLVNKKKTKLWSK